MPHAHRLEGKAATADLVALDRCRLIEWEAGAVVIPQLRKQEGESVSPPPPPAPATRPCYGPDLTLPHTVTPMQPVASLQPRPCFLPAADFSLMYIPLGSQPVISFQKPNGKMTCFLGVRQQTKLPCDSAMGCSWARPLVLRPHC